MRLIVVYFSLLWRQCICLRNARFIFLTENNTVRDATLESLLHLGFSRHLFNRFFNKNDE